MGVKSLWQLLEPVGKRINIEALQGKKLAVGALQGMRISGLSEQSRNGC